MQTITNRNLSINRSGLFLLTSLSLFFSRAPDAIAGAWLQPEGYGEYLSNYVEYYAGRYFDEEGDRYDDFAFLKTEYAPYVEYGLTGDITIGGSARMHNIYSKSPYADNSFDTYVNSAHVFARAYLVQYEDFVSSIEPNLYLPIESELDINPEGNELMPGVKFNLGYGFPQGSYIDCSVNFRHRYDNDLNDMLMYELSYGHRVRPDITILAQVFYTDTTGRIDKTDFGNYDVTKLQLSGIWHAYKRLNYQLGAGFDLEGENTSSGITGIYSVWYKF